MKNPILTLLVILTFGTFANAQQWMRSLDIAQKLAMVQNKMVLMVWEESTLYDYPVVYRNERGRTLVVSNLFLDENISPLIWENFVPVIVSENAYHDLYMAVKGKRSERYIDKLNDDTIKIMDINGNILNVSGYKDGWQNMNRVGDDLWVQNISKIINVYGLNTKYIENELRNYKNDKNFYSAFFLASKYLDFALYTKERTRPRIIDLSNIYLDEARRFVETENLEGKSSLLLRCDLLDIQEFLLVRRPKKVLRSLKRIEKDDTFETNEGFIAFLYYTAYMSLGKEEEAQEWKSKVSSLNLKKAEKIINLNI